MKQVLIVSVILIGIFAMWQLLGTKDGDQTATIEQALKVFEQNNDEQLESTNPFAIETLRKRPYYGGEITIEQTLSENPLYTAYRVSYLSDGLKIFAAMNIPKGEGLFPVIILNHGYFNQTSFSTGDGTRTMADILANNGYLTLASDYRGHGESESDIVQRGHRPEYSVDVLNLISSVDSLENADSNNLGIWGHSMGGEVTLKVLEVNEQTKAAVLWAPTSGNASDNVGFYRGRRLDSSRQNNSNLSEVSPINYLKYITAPISLHQGLSDTEVNPEWAKQLNDALKKEGKSVDYFEYPGQDHNFKNYGWSEISPRTVEFFDKYLKKIKYTRN